jgi:hypothetical protein
LLKDELDRSVSRLGFDYGDRVYAGLKFLVGFAYGNYFTVVGSKAKTIALSDVFEDFKMCHG